MAIYVKFLWFPYFLCFFMVFGFQSWFNHTHWYYPYRSFKHSNWRRHKL